MKPKSGASKVNVSMPKDLFDYLKRRVEEHNAKPENIYRPTDFSKMVQKAVHEMMEHDRSGLQNSVQKSSSKASNVSPDVDAKMVRPYKRSVGGSSTATTARSRKTG